MAFSHIKISSHKYIQQIFTTKLVWNLKLREIFLEKLGKRLHSSPQFLSLHLLRLNDAFTANRTKPTWIRLKQCFRLPQQTFCPVFRAICLFNQRFKSCVKNCLLGCTKLLLCVLMRERLNYKTDNTVTDLRMERIEPALPLRKRLPFGHQISSLSLPCC